jgi:uncharacterized protein with GYD domain
VEKLHKPLDYVGPREQCDFPALSELPLSKGVPHAAVSSPSQFHLGSHVALDWESAGPLEAVRGPIEKLGGKIEHGYFAFGEHDAILITDMPDNISAAAIALAFAGGGALRNCTTTLLLTTAEALDAMRKAATCGYKPMQAAAGAASR